MEVLDNLLFGLVFSAIVSALAYRRQSLSGSGIVGATIVGTLIFGFGGWVWGLTLITFFVTSSALSHYREKRRDLADKFAKGQRRDLGQTLANGGAGALAAVAFALSPEPIFLAAFVGAIATVNADTWATELGVLNPTPPRLITSGRVVEVGTSGGVSWLGTLASAAGALAIGGAAFGFDLIARLVSGGDGARYAWALPVALLSGLAGSLADSLMGATVQAMYYCPRCEKETEKARHGCGLVTQHRRGWRWLDNDVVNLLSSLVGALVAAALFALL